MKKIILGLFLTVGISGMALAGNESNNVESVKNNLKEKSEVIKAIDKVDFEKPFDCWYGTTTNYFNADGTLSASISIGFAASCLPGDEDGTISIRVKKVVQASTDVN
jgi:hypothetical protein